MIIKESFEVDVAKEAAVAFLVDVERMSACVPGVEGVRAVGEDYEATLRLQLGPVRSEFAGRARLDVSGAPDLLKATVEGRDRVTGSQVQVAFEAGVSERPGPRTVVDCTADVTIRGRLGQFGTGMITSTAKSVLREFSACAGKTLALESTRSGPAVAGAPAAPRPSTARIAARSITIYVADLWSRLTSRVRRRRDAGGDG